MGILGLVIVLAAAANMMMPGTTASRLGASFVTLVAFSAGALLLSGAHLRRMLISVFSGKTEPDSLAAAAQEWAHARGYILAAGGLALAGGAATTLRAIVQSCMGMAQGGFAPTIACAGLAEALKSAVGAMGLLFVALALAYGVCLPVQRRLESRAAAQGTSA